MQNFLDIGPYAEVIYYISQIGAGVAVLIALWITRQQWRDLNRAALETQYAAYSAGYQEYQTLLATRPELVAILQKGAIGLDQLTECERAQYGALMSKSLETIYLFHQLEMNSRRGWKAAVTELIRAQMGSKGAREWWDGAKGVWSLETAKMISEALGD